MKKLFFRLFLFAALVLVLNAGTNVGLTEDYAGTKVGAVYKPVIFQKIRLKHPPIREMPDIGAYEYRDR